MEFTEIGGLFYGFLNSYTRRMLWTMANSPVAQKALYVEDTVKVSVTLIHCSTARVLAL